MGRLICGNTFKHYCNSFSLALFQGTYVLQDNKFALLTQLSSGKQYLEEAPKVRMILGPSYSDIILSKLFIAREMKC